MSERKIRPSKSFGGEAQAGGLIRTPFSRHFGTS